MTERERFDRCLDVVLELEGGYVDDPRDPGGATNLGVTRASLSDWLGHPATVDQVRALTRSTVAPLYRARYWTVTGCDHLMPGVDLLTFDTAVNMGPAVSGRFLQQACGAIADGVVGPQTTAMARTKPAASLIHSISAYRRARYLSLAGFDTYGRGWMKRLDRVTALALADAPPSTGFGADLTRKALEA